MKKLLSNTAFLLIAVVIAFGTGVLFGNKNPTQAEVLSRFAGINTTPPEGVDFSPVWKAWHVLEEKYVPATSTDPLTDDEKVWGMVEGLAKAYGDPYTVFLPPEENEMFEADISGEFGGVGMEIGIRDGVITVITPLKDSPAEKAGVRTGDKILKIGETSTQDLNVDEAVRMIRGEVGTSVTITISREGEGEFREITIVRDTIVIPTLATELRPDGIFVIELYNFDANSPVEFRRAMREYLQSGSKKLILDLRGNPGGYLEAAVDIASWFLPAGKVIVQEDFGNDADHKVHRSKGYNVFPHDAQMVILINEGSASASEIVAGALKEQEVATLIGAKSYGKGSVQELVGITTNTSLKVTIARWLTPLGTSISGNGLEPEIAVDLTLEDYEAERDPQLDAAVKHLLEN